MKTLLKLALILAVAATGIVGCGGKEEQPPAQKPGVSKKGGPPLPGNLQEMMQKMKQKAAQK